MGPDDGGGGGGGVESLMSAENTQFILASVFHFYVDLALII